MWGFLSLGTQAFSPLPEPRLISRERTAHTYGEEGEGRLKVGGCGSEKPDQGVRSTPKADEQTRNGKQFVGCDGCRPVEPAERRNGQSLKGYPPATRESGDEGEHEVGERLMVGGEGTTKRMNEHTRQQILKGCMAAFLLFGNLWSVVSKGDRYDFV